MNQYNLTRFIRLAMTKTVPVELIIAFQVPFLFMCMVLLGCWCYWFCCAQNKPKKRRYVHQIVDVMVHDSYPPITPRTSNPISLPYQYLYRRHKR
jgi:hypothetical protein